jgi:hypothetical protein
MNENETIIGILVERDEVTKEEATATLKACHEEMMGRIEEGDLGLLEDIFMRNLGLEPDYMIEFLCDLM